MGIRNLSSLEIAGSRPALHLVIKSDADLRMPIDEAPADQTGIVGCARGVIVALGFQAAAVVLGIALWKLHFLFH